MNLVIPMAGRGSRFAEVGIDVPKPMISVRGRPMYAWAVESLPLGLASRLIFICLAEHLRDRALEADLRARYAAYDPLIIPLDRVTSGQAATVLEARRWIDSTTPLVIYNADTYLKSPLEQRLRNAEPGLDGLLTVFRAPGDKWSFARVDEHGRVVETAEKRRISDWASAGLYYFARGADFVRHADAMIADDERERGEFYVAPVYNRMIATGANIQLDVADEVWALGTPEDLASFEATYPR